MPRKLGIAFFLLSLLHLQHAYAARNDPEDSSPRKKLKLKKATAKSDRMTRLLSVIESKPYSFGAIRPSNGSHHIGGQVSDKIRAVFKSFIIINNIIVDYFFVATLHANMYALRIK
jgi:hypothetical protein